MSVHTSVTDFTQVWVPGGSTSPLHFRAALQWIADTGTIVDFAGNFLSTIAWEDTIGFC